MSCEGMNPLIIASFSVKTAETKEYDVAVVLLL